MFTSDRFAVLGIKDVYALGAIQPLRIYAKEVILN